MLIKTDAMAKPPPGIFFNRSNCGQANQAIAKTILTFTKIPVAHTPLLSESLHPKLAMAANSPKTTAAIPTKCRCHSMVFLSIEGGFMDGQIGRQRQQRKKEVL